MQEKVVHGKREKKKKKKGKVWKIQFPVWEVGCKLYCILVLLYRRDTLKGWIYAGGI